MQLTEELETTSVCEIELIETIGLEATLKLEDHFGASYLYVPAKAPTKAMIEAIGLQDAMKLVERFRGCDIWVPRALQIKNRNNKLCNELISTGKTIEELALKFSMKIPNIKRILKERNINA